MTDRQTFLSIRNWVSQVQMHADISVNKLLIGNKCDMENRAISVEEGEALAKEYNIPFFETSAKQDINVGASFLAIATQVKNRLTSTSSDGAPNKSSVALNASTTTAKKEGCC